MSTFSYLDSVMSEQHIFLVGPMGAGKTTIGRQLAKLLERPFFDIDAEIEARCGADIQWIFDREGEQGFRQRESRVLEDIAVAHDSAVIATGGGLVLADANRRLLRAHGKTVYLVASKEQLYRRTRKDKKRPLLQVENREQVIEQLLEKRDPLYREVADLVFPAVGGQVLAVTKRLLDALETL